MHPGFLVFSANEPIGRHGRAPTMERPENMTQHVFMAAKTRLLVVPSARFPSKIIFGCAEKAGEKRYGKYPRIFRLLVCPSQRAMAVQFSELCESDLAVVLQARSIMVGVPDTGDSPLKTELGPRRKAIRLLLASANNQEGMAAVDGERTPLYVRH